jgi:hypothetical protein
MVDQLPIVTVADSCCRCQNLMPVCLNFVFQILYTLTTTGYKVRKKGFFVRGRVCYVIQ